MIIWSHRKVAALIATLVITLIAALFYTPAKAQDVGEPVTVTITGSGTVRSGNGWSDPILCPGDCTGATINGFATLLATADVGWSAEDWGGLCAGQPSSFCVRNFFAGGSVSMAFVSVPEIDVRGGPTVLSVANGDTMPDRQNGTDFGIANISGGTVDQTFSIWNIGAAALAINGTPQVSLSGPDAADFSLLSPPALSVSPDVSTTFVLRFDPSAVGERTATVTIANNDSDEAPYSFTIMGIGYDATAGPAPVSYAESIDGDLKSDTVYVPCSLSGFADQFILGVGVNRWTGTHGVTGNRVNQNDMFRAILPAGLYIDTITFQRHGGSGIYNFSLTDAGSQTLIETSAPGALYDYDPPSQNLILTFMLIADFNPWPVDWTVTVSVIGSMQGGSGPVLTLESESALPPQFNVNEGHLGTACGRFSDLERDAVTILPGPLTASPLLPEIAPSQTFVESSANSSGRWEWSVTPVDGPSDSQEVVLRATDNSPAGPHSSQLPFQLRVANVAPRVNWPSVSPDRSNEIATVTAQATWSDPGVLDVATCIMDYGDGSAPVAGVATFNNGSGLCVAPSHTYTDSGAFNISFEVTDKDGGVGSQTSVYRVQNLPPVISKLVNNGPVKENRPVTITVSATDPAGPADPLNYALDCDKNSVFEVGPQAQNSASCTFSTFGTYTVGVQVRDDDGGRSITSTVVTVFPNSHPVANNQSISTDEDTSIGTTFTASDADGDSLTYSVVNVPGNGQVSGTPPMVTYTPNANFAGVDSFTFKANDGDDDSLIATIAITVRAVNDAPIADDDSFNIDEDTPLSGSVAGNDSDVDADILAYSLVTNVSNGNLTFNPDGSFTYTPAANYHGSDTFTYQTSDGNIGTDSATVNITVSAVNDAPQARADTAATNEDAAVTISVMTNDSDSADGSLLNPASISVIYGPTSGATGVNAVNGTIIYTPTANFYGSDSFNYRVCDNGTPVPPACGSATVNITVTAVVTDDDDGDGVADQNDTFPLDPTETIDSDGDGAGDNADTDDDNDGVTDGSDDFPFDASESVDTDGDGMGNNADTDDDGDGVEDSNDALPLDPTESVDTDNDSTGNNADTDDDNDDVADDSDAFPLNPTESVDTDSDGIGNNADTDDDGDGVEDGNDAFPLNPSESVDTNGDGTGDNADSDDDDDGVVDDEDAFPLDENESVDSDGDGSGNNADTDDDNDSVADSNDAFPLDDSESVDTDGDGTGNNADSDDDSDGVADSNDAFPLDENESVDTDGDGTGNNADTDDDEDGVEDSNDALPLNPTESVDTDNDSTGNNADTDDDNDDVADNSDAFPLNPSESVDTDGDGTGNNADTDDDNDSVADSNDAFTLNSSESVDTDGDGTGDNADSDDDSDGVADSNDAFPLDENESVDTDGDGTGNNADTDDDNDGVEDSSDALPLNPTESVDTDNDSTGNNADTDDDNDGVANTGDAFPLNPIESVDTDSDGMGNNADTDDDGDGVEDGNDAFTLNSSESVDTDGDGSGDNVDTDDDDDGVTDGSDAFPLDKNENVDTDGDGIGNNADTDDDRDGIADSNDAFPLDENESLDTDGDGTGNNADTDDDEDGVEDSNDDLPLDPSDSADTDGDGTGDNTDLDDDGDGTADTNDTFPLNNNESVDTDSDGTGNNADADDDNDGVDDGSDAFPQNPSESIDTDNDSTGDYADSDDDGDGVADEDDAFPLDPAESVDTNGDGTGNNADADDDNDGVADSDDAFPLDPDESVDTDDDGTGNNADTDKDNDGVADAQPDNCPLISNPDQADNDADALGDACDNASAMLGDMVWFDQDNNGIQGPDEPGIGGVGIELYKVDEVAVASVDGTLVATTTTNSTGDYLFTNLESGDYYVLYTAPSGYGFTQGGLDSDPIAPQVLLSLSNFEVQGAAEFDEDLVYTILYTNTDASEVATNIVITAAVPAGTTFVAENSDGGWSCSGVNAGSVCTVTIPALAAQSGGSLAFVVNLKGAEGDVPTMLLLSAGLTHGSQARTEIFTLGEGEENHSVKAGLVRTLVVTQQTSVPDGPTALPGIEQPKQQRFVFLPAVQTQG